MRSAAWPTSCQLSRKNEAWWNFAGSSEWMNATSCALVAQERKAPIMVLSGVTTFSVSWKSSTSVNSFAVSGMFGP